MDENQGWKEWSQHVLIELKRLNQNNENLGNKFDELNILSDRNTRSLEEHIRRSNLLEEALKPLQQTDTILRALVKSVAVIAGMLGIIYTAFKLISGV